MKSCCDAWHHQTKAVLWPFANGAFAADLPAKAGASEGMGVLRALWHAFSTDRVGRRERNPHQISPLCNSLNRGHRACGVE